MHMIPTNDKEILDGFRNFNEHITKEYFYGYCKKAYNVFDHKYQLHNKPGMDFYSLAHEYYIQLITHKFKQLEDRPSHMPLSAWMMGGFRFVVLDAIKAYNKEFEGASNLCQDDVLDYLRTSEKYKDMLKDVSEEVAEHYRDRKMHAIAHMVIYLGFSQKETAAELGMTPAAINQRYKKMMDEVVTPFVMNNYSYGIPFDCFEDIFDSYAPEHGSGLFAFDLLENVADKTPSNERVTPSNITSLEKNEILVFGSNLKGIHAAGLSRIANLYYGAEWGNGVGPQGQSYAIPTMQGGVETIKPYADQFLDYATEHPELKFLVTRLGCGFAGFEPSDIAPLFRRAKDMKNISLPEEFWREIK